MQDQVTSNIPATGFAAYGTESTRSRKEVEFNHSARFTFSSFSLIQLILGQQLQTQEAGAHTLKTELTLLSKLALLPHTGSINEEEKPTVQLTRVEVRQLKLWLEARMAHCEKERDQRVELTDSEASRNYTALMDGEPLPYSQNQQSQKFNPDTYIAQKFLLLDLREWLAGDIID